MSKKTITVLRNTFALGQLLQAGEVHEVEAGVADELVAMKKAAHGGEKKAKRAKAAKPKDPETGKPKEPVTGEDGDDQDGDDEDGDDDQDGGES